MNQRNLQIVFLTPESNSSQLKEEYENLEVNNTLNHFKKWIYWDSSQSGGIVSMVRNVLDKESRGEINPINEYMRHTLKAFIRHSIDMVQPITMKTMRTGEDIGEVVDHAVIQTKDGASYRVVMRDSAQVQVFNLATDDKEIARQILERYIDENELAIKYKELNTRAIGRQFFKLYSNKQ
jgi:hypothetical protein